MGAVFESVHESIERRVAIKVLHPEFARLPEFTGRFFNEARAVNRVAHPGLVQISDYGQLPDGMAYIVMEFLQGESLSHRMRQSGGSLPLADVLNIGWQLADSLTAAHKKQIVHRDPSPISTRKPPQQIGLSTSTRGPTRLLSKWTTQQLHRPKCGSRSAKHDRLLRRPSRSCDLAGLKRQTRSSRENSPHRDQIGPSPSCIESVWMNKRCASCFEPERPIAWS